MNTDPQQQLTDYQKLADLAIDWELPKHQLKLQPYEKLLAISEEPFCLTIATERFTLDDSSSGTVLTGCSVVEITFLYDPETDQYDRSELVASSDTDFKPVRYTRYQGKSVAQWLDGLRHERMCYRPGTSVNPQDSYERTVDRWEV